MTSEMPMLEPILRQLVFGLGEASHVREGDASAGLDRHGLIQPASREPSISSRIRPTIGDSAH
ncbi:hypothetical protein CAK95_03245 [Pseudorhodoplanes sinuspersici]|uniref:Uncharacterized protein n=1 Tax=Pseudorhodoplanes sinuspersici TaxID=1235591 RepID=A0A1W6ZLM5_9HYPH|nr:hypothetical protein CAK95_03245 [Pseudorhodoplanes sinuspersici]